MLGAIDPKKVKGKILVCKTNDDEDTFFRMDKGYEALRSGAVAMIIGGNHLVLDEPDVHLLPSVHLKYDDTLAIYSYLNSTKNPMATIHPPENVLNVKPSPAIAFFSSRGPSRFVPDILKVFFFLIFVKKCVFCLVLIFPRESCCNFCFVLLFYFL